MSAVIESGQEYLRLMTMDDLDAVMAIEVRAYPHHWTRGIFRDCLHVGYSCWVFERDDSIIGYTVMSMGAGEAHILNLCVDPDYQRQGIGQQILLHMMELARAHRAEMLLLEVRPSNKGAIDLYRKQGFNEVGARRAYYPSDDGTREDALVMAISLPELE